METQYNKTYRMQQKHSKREVYSDKCLHQEKKKRSQINNLTVHLKKLEKRGTNSAQSQQKKGNNKDQNRNKLN